MATLTRLQVYQLAKNAGLSPTGAVVATAVAQAESGFRTDAQGDVNLQDDKWGPSVGLWQIRSLKAQYGTGQTRDASRLTDPAFNAKSMAEISRTGSNFKAWTTFTKGTYKQFLNPATQVGLSDPDTSKSSDNPGITDYLTDPAGSAAKLVGNAFADVFGGWEKSLLEVGLKLGITGVAGALCVAGLWKAVTPNH